MISKEFLTRYSKNVSLLLSVTALIMAATTLVFLFKNQNSTAIATADIQAVMDAQKLVWVQRMKAGEGTQVL